MRREKKKINHYLKVIANKSVPKSKIIFVLKKHKNKNYYNFINSNKKISILFASQKRN